MTTKRRLALRGRVPSPTSLSGLAPMVAFAAVLACVPAVFTRVGFYTMANAVVMGIMALATVGLVLVMGYAGQVSLGQAAFFGIGAYSSGLLTVMAGVHPIVAMLAGMVLAGLIAAVVGLSVFRARGHYLAMATLAFGLVTFFGAKEVAVTGGPSGLPDVPKLALGPLVLGSDLRYWWLVGAVLLVAVLLARNLVDSRVGRALRALGDSEPAAAASAVDVRRHKMIVFVVAAVFAAVAGSLYAHWTTFIDPTSTLDLLLSIQLLIMATVGGLRSVWGAPLGAFVVVSLSQGARELLPRLSSQVGGQFEIVVYGLALILVLLFLPDGLAGGARRLGRWLARRAGLAGRAGLRGTAGTAGTAGASGAGPDRTGAGRAGMDQATTGRASVNQAGADQVEADQAGVDQAVDGDAPRPVGAGSSATGPGWIGARPGPHGSGPQGFGSRGPGHAVLVVRGLRRTYGGVAAIDGLDLVLPAAPARVASAPRASARAAPTSPAYAAPAPGPGPGPGVPDGAGEAEGAWPGRALGGDPGDDPGRAASRDAGRAAARDGLAAGAAPAPPGRMPITGLIGPNGAGKTTLFNLLSGLATPDAGEIELLGTGVTGWRPDRIARLGLARTFQNLELFGSMTVLENVMVGRHGHTRAGTLSALLRLRAGRLEERGSREAAFAVLARAGIAHLAGRTAAELPLGDQRRVEVARALAAEPRLLLLDEPFAGLASADAEALIALVREVAAAGVAVLLVEHDMRVVMGLCDRIVVLNQGRVIADGTPAEVRDDPVVLAAYLGAGLDDLPDPVAVP